MDMILKEALEKEKQRQQNNIELIASENYVSKDVLELQGSILTNKYAEGYADKRYYGGCEYVDIFEKKAIEYITKKVEELIRQREENISLAGKLRELVESAQNKEPDWEENVEEAEGQFSEELIETLKLVGKDKGKKSQNYQDALKLLNARINNLETNLHIEIDMERTEDRSKALSFIGIEVAEALKTIPKPAEMIEETVVEAETEEVVLATEELVTKEVQVKAPVVAIEENTEEQELLEYQESVLFDKKPSLWQKFKNSKLARAVSYVFKIRVKIKIELPNALPEGRGE